MKNPLRIIENIFLWSSGAHVETIRKVPEEKSKYFGIGGTIIFTGLMAALAGGYAFSYAFPDKKMYAVIFALFWGSLIYNLDRYIVATFGVGDGKKTISWQELLEASPRIVMAIILGFVISTPLELKLFETSINSYISDINARLIAEHDSLVRTKGNIKILPIQRQIDKINFDINKRNDDLKVLRDKRDKAYQDMVDEASGTGGTGTKGEGPIYNKKKKRYDNLLKEYNDLKKDYDVLNKNDRNHLKILENELKDIFASFEQNEKNYDRIKAKNHGLMAQLKALDALTKENSFLRGSKWLITLLFIFIEIAPVMFKMMTERGPYDDLIDELKYEYKVKELLKKSKINSEINAELKLISEKNSQKLKAELFANDRLLNEIANAQSEIAIVAIEAWKKEQLKKVKQSPSIIVKSSENKC